MKSLLSFVTLALVGLVGSLHSLPTDSDSSSMPEFDEPTPHVLTIIRGTIEALDSKSQTVAIKTDQGRIVLLRVDDRHHFARLKSGARVNLEIDWDGTGSTSQAPVSEVRSHI